MTTTTAQSSPTLVLDAGLEAERSLDAAAVPPARGQLDWSFELPYPVDARPRSLNPMQAAAEDEELARWDLGGSADPSYPSSQASYHPGTRVVVDTRLAKRRTGVVATAAPRHGLTPERVQAQARSHGYWPFRLCFEAGQRQKKGPGGETRVAFTVGLSGKVKRAWLLDSKLENSTTAACLVHETSKLEFAPRPARALSMVASIRIWPGDVDLPAVPVPAPIVAGGAFDPAAVSALLSTKRTQIEACLTEARRADPSVWGRLALAAILEVDGSVHRISEIESHFPSAAAMRCVQVALSSIVFPSVNGKPFTLVLALRLSPPLGTADRTEQVGPDANPDPSLPEDGGTSD